MTQRTKKLQVQQKPKLHSVRTAVKRGGPASRSTDGEAGGIGPAHAPDWLDEVLDRREVIRGLLDDLNFDPPNPVGSAGVASAGTGPRTSHAVARFILEGAKAAPDVFARFRNGAAGNPAKAGKSAKSAKAGKSIKDGKSGKANTDIGPDVRELFGENADLFAPDAVADSAELIEELSDLDLLTETVHGNASLIGLLALSWHWRACSPPFPEIQERGSWRELMFALLELRRAGRDDGPLTRAILAGAVCSAFGRVDAEGEAPSSPAESVSAAVIRAAGDLAAARRAKEAFAQLNLSECSELTSAMSRTMAVMFLSKKEEDKGGPESPLLAFFSTAAAMRELWGVFETALRSFRFSLCQVAASVAGGSIPEIRSGMPEGSEEFMAFCRARVKTWAEAADVFYNTSLDAFDVLDTLSEAVRALGEILARLEESGSARDASELRELCVKLEALTKGDADWESKVPLAGEMFRLLKAPKPLSQDDLVPLENDFSVSFHRKLARGAFDSVLTGASTDGAASATTIGAAPAGVTGAASAQTIDEVGTSIAGGAPPAATGAVAASAAAASEVAGDIPKPTSIVAEGRRDSARYPDELSGSIAEEGMSQNGAAGGPGAGFRDVMAEIGKLAVASGSEVSAPAEKAGISGGAAAEISEKPAHAMPESSPEAEVKAGHEVETRAVAKAGHEVEAKAEAEVKADAAADAEAEPEAAAISDEAAANEAAAVVAGLTPYSHESDPFREFWGLTSAELAQVIREKFGDLLERGVLPAEEAAYDPDAFEDFREGASAARRLKKPLSASGIADIPTASPGGAPSSAPSPSADSPSSRAFPSTRPYLVPPAPASGQSPASAIPSDTSPSSRPASPEHSPLEGASLAAAIAAQAEAAYRAGEAEREAAEAAERSIAEAAEAEKVAARAKDFRRHLSALCRKLAGSGDTRPLYWLAAASPRGVFPESLARLMHAGLRFQPSPAAARESFFRALEALPVPPLEDGEALAVDPEPALFLFAGLVRAAASCPDQALAPALDALEWSLPARLKGGLVEALADLTLRADADGVLKALRRMADLRDKDRRLGGLKAKTRKFLEDMPKRSTSYVPANTVWKNLILPGGELHGLLERCGNDGADQRALDALKEEADSLRDLAHVRELVNQYDRRSGRKEEINAAAFAAISSYCSLTADLADEWLEFRAASAGAGGDWIAALMEAVFSEAAKAARAVPDFDANAWAGDADENGRANGNGNGAHANVGGNAHGTVDAGAAGDAGFAGDGPARFADWDGEDLPADGARLLREELARVAGRAFLDDWDTPRDSAWGPKGFHAQDPEADLASWLLLCPNAASANGIPGAPLAGVVGALASGPWDRTAEDRAFLERVMEDEVVIPALFLEAVEGAGKRRDEGGRGFAEILFEHSGRKIDEAEIFLEGVGELIDNMSSSGALDGQAAVALSREAGDALQAVLAAAPEADARAAARAVGRGAAAEAKARAAL
ncbi:MAG: hypothetical protein LBR80_12205, partial [Deltaproteobacteria bacterium]|nr:hypothetical protein [Deltaproteobacteria bacterium]